jgi:hypothetical protein
MIYVHASIVRIAPSFTSILNVAKGNIKNINIRKADEPITKITMLLANPHIAIKNMIISMANQIIKPWIDMITNINIQYL